MTTRTLRLESVLAASVLGTLALAFIGCSGSKSDSGDAVAAAQRKEPAPVSASGPAQLAAAPILSAAGTRPAAVNRPDVEPPPVAPRADAVRVPSQQLASDAKAGEPGSREREWAKSVPRVSDKDKTEDIEARYDSEWRRYSYPTGRIPAGSWRLRAMEHVAKYVPEGVPDGVGTLPRGGAGTNAPVLPTANWTSFGPSPLDATGTTNNAYQYGDVVGRINALAFQPGSSTIAYAGAPVGGLWKTTNCCSASTTWSSLWHDETFPNNSVGAIAIDDVDTNVIYAGTGDSEVPAFDMFGDGIYKSTDGGATWNQYGANVMSPYTSPGAPGASCCSLAPDQNINNIVIDPRNHNTIVAGASYGVFISYDAGLTWTQYDVVDRNSATYNTSAQRVTSILMDGNTNPSTIYVALGYPYTSTRRANLIGGANGVYKAQVPSSGAPTFTLLSSGFPAGTANGTVSSNVGRIELAWNAAHTHIYAHVAHYANVGQTLGIYHLNVALSTWNLLTGTAETSWTTCGTGGNESDQAWYDLTLDMDPLSDTTLYSGRTNLWKITLNSATSPTSATLTDLSGVYSQSCSQYGTLHPDQHSFAFQPTSNPTKFLVGNDGGVYYGTGAAGGFTRTMSGIVAIQFYAGQLGRDFANVSGSTTQWAFGGMQDNGNASWDSSQTDFRWIGRSVGGDGFFTAFDPIAGTRTAGRWITSYANGALSCSGTGAANAFSACSPNYAASDRPDWSTPFIMDQWNCATTSCGNVVLGTNFAWASVNGGSTWTKVTTTDLTKGGNADAISINVAHKNPGSVIIGTNDGNVQWSNNVFTGANCTAAAADGGTFACTVNGSSTWVNLTGGNLVLPNRAIGGVVFDPNSNTTFYAAIAGFGVNTPSQPGHVYMGSCSASPCTTGNVTWTNKSGNLPDVPVEAIQVNPNLPNQVFIGTNLGFYYTNDITAVAPVWNRYQTGMPNTRITHLAVDRGVSATPRASTTLSAWTYGHGMFVTQIGLPTCDKPAAPTNLVATAPSNNRITLNWTASAGSPAATSYKIYRIQSPTACPVNGYSYLATVAAPTTTYNDDGVSGGSTYSYRIVAVESSGCVSVESACASAVATGSCTLPPTSPSNVTLTAPQSSSCVLNLSWSASTSRCGGSVTYNIYRSTTTPVSPVAGNRIASGLSTTTYSDTALLPGTYYYLVRAYDSATAAEDAGTTEVSGASAGTTATTTLYSETFDSLADGNMAGFTLSGTTGTSWRGVMTCSPNQSASKIFRFGGATCTGTYASNLNGRASINGAAGFAIPAGKTGVRLEFYHRWLFEAGWDGGSLEIMRQGDGSWTYVPASAIVSGTTSYTGNANGRQVFTGTANNTQMYLTQVDLDAVCNSIAGNTGGCAGKTIFVAFNTFTDGTTNDDGWFIDNVKLTYDTVTPCTSACTAPTAATIAVAATASQQVTVSLSAPGNGATYNLYRAANDPTCPAGGTAIATGLTAASFPYVDNGRTGGVSYTYSIESVASNPACKTSGNCATAIAWGDCTTPPTFAGLPAGGATASAGTTCGVDLSWVAATSGCAGHGVTYSIYRDTSSGFTPGLSNRIDTGVVGTTYTDTAALLPSTAYYYVVRAADAASGVEETNTTRRSATTGASCSSAPVQVQAFTIRSTGDATNGTNLLEWLNPAIVAAGSTITINYRTDTYPTAANDPSAVVILRNRAVTANAADSFTHTPLVLGTTYYYAIWVRY
jgi:hypothetical protein